MLLVTYYVTNKISIFVGKLQNMQEQSFLTQLNSVDLLIDRYDICSNMTEHNHVDSPDIDIFTTADRKILMANYNPNVLKDNQPFINVDFLNDDEISFIINQRLDTITNQLMRGFYLNVLCNGQKKPNCKHVNQLINSYSAYLAEGESHDVVDILDVINSLMYIAVTYKNCKQTIQNTVNDFLSICDTLWVKREIIIDSYRIKFYKSQEINRLSSLFCYPEKLDEDYNRNKEYYQVLINCTNDVTKKEKYFHLLAENEDVLLRLHQNDIISVNLLTSKYEYLKQGKFEEEANECYKELIKAKTNDRGVETIISQLIIPNEFYHFFINLIINSDNPIQTIASEDRLLPGEYNLMDNSQSFILNRMGVKCIYTDKNGNSHDKEQFYRAHKIDLTYIQNYQIITAASIHHALRVLIDRKEFCSDAIIGYLKNTWLGTPRMQINSSLQNSKETWLEQIQPSLRIICKELIKEITSKGKYRGEYICGMDSLTMKLEGCIRDICFHYGIETIRPNRDEVLLEQILDRLSSALDNDCTPIVSKQTMNLLFGTLTRRGKNLRNDIAHGMSTIDDYNVLNAITVLHCLLRISAVKI